MKKKVLCALFAMLIAVASVSSAFADTKSLQSISVGTYGTCHTTYISTVYIQNVGYDWYRFKFQPIVELIYSPSTNAPTINGHYYGYARPQGTDGTLYGTQFKIYYTHTTAWIPNDSGTSANKVKFKVYNGIYENDHSITNTTMEIPSSSCALMIGTYYN